MNIAIFGYSGFIGSHISKELNKINNVFEWLEERAPFLFLEVLSKLSKNPEYILEKQSKNPAKALRCYPRKPEDGEINWNNSASEILTLINASSEPFAGAYSTYKNEKIVIWNAEIVKDEEEPPK